MVCAHCGHDHRTEHCPNFCKLCQVVGHRQKRADCQFHVCSKCNTVGHSARACKAPQLQQRMVRGEREPENDHSQSDAPMAADGDRHADDGDDECDQLNRTNDCEPDDNMSNDDDDADRDLNDHNDDDDDAEQVLIGGDDPVCKSCGNFGHRSHRDHKCPNHHCTHCHKQGHTKRFCPDVQCPHCDLFGHVNKKDCKYKHCINVEVDWLNILLSVSASHTITELFKASECTVDPNSLRSGGKFRKFADCQWEHVKQTCDSIGAQQLHTIIIGIRDSHPPRNAPYGAWGRKAPGVGARARRAQSRAH